MHGTTITQIYIIKHSHAYKDTGVCIVASYIAIAILIETGEFMMACSVCKVPVFHSRIVGY